MKILPNIGRKAIWFEYKNNIGVGWIHFETRDEIQMMSYVPYSASNTIIQTYKRTGNIINKNKEWWGNRYEPDE